MTKVTQKSNGSEGLALVSDPSAIEAVMAEMPAPATIRPSIEEDFDFEQMEAKAPAEELVEPKADAEYVRVRKPGSKDVVFAHPEWRMELYLLIPEDVRGRERIFRYAVAPAVAEKFPRFCRRVELIPYANKDGELFLWPILLESALTGEMSDYSTSLRARIRQGRGQWCRYETDSKRPRYLLYRQAGQKEAPEWPEGGIRQMVKAAFRGHVITSVSAEALQERIGELVPEE